MKFNLKIPLKSFNKSKEEWRDKVVGPPEHTKVK